MNAPRALGAVLAWVVAVGAATAVAMVAISAVGSGITGQGPRPLTEAEVAQSLAAATASVTQGPAPTSTPAPTGSPSEPPSGSPSVSQPPPVAEPEVIASPGGSVLARCDGTAVVIVSSTPAQGYHVDGVEPEDGGVTVSFESTAGGDDDAPEHDVLVRCDTGSPVGTITTD